jgi:hypothetical protein
MSTLQYLFLQCSNNVPEITRFQEASRKVPARFQQDFSAVPAMFRQGSRKVPARFQGPEIETQEIL